MTWVLPSSPQSPAYRDVFASIETERDRRRKIARRRALCEADFWAYLRIVSSFGRFRIQDRNHPARGQRWVDQPWVFARAREIQGDIDERRTMVFFNYPRFYFKTELRTRQATLWTLARNPSETTGIITDKKQGPGEKMMEGINDEVTRNAVLKATWPETFGEVAQMDKESMTVGRPLGPTEPSVSIHSLYALPHGMHLTILLMDDCVVESTVLTARGIAKAEAAMRNIAPLGADESMKHFVGTIWDRDDPYCRLLADGTIKHHRLQTAYTPPNGESWVADADTKDWTPNLRSRVFLDGWRDEMKEYVFACQMMQTPVARHKQGFLPHWYRTYSNSPVKEAMGKPRVILVDPAGDGSGEEPDYWAFWVLGLGGDRIRYPLDLWRERLTFVDAMNLWFALAKKWAPIDLSLVEQKAAESIVGSLRQEMERRRFRFKVRPVDLKRSKESRIQNLMMAEQREEVRYPEHGFGHGSGPFYIDALRAAVRDLQPGEPTRDEITTHVDTLEQFRKEERDRWTPVKRSTLYDDMLDSLSMSCVPETDNMLPWPESARRTEEDEVNVEMTLAERLHRHMLSRPDDFDGEPSAYVT